MQRPNFKVRLPIVCALLFFSAIVECASAAVQLRGSTTLLPLAQAVAESYMQEHKGSRIIVAGGGTERGFKSIYDGTADVAMASSEPSLDYINQISLHQRDIEKFLIGYAPIFIAVNKSNPLNDISLKKLADIYTGRLANWSELNGLSQPINVLVGPPTGGVNASWKELILKNVDTYTPSAKVLANEERYEFLQKNPNSIAFLVGDPAEFKHVKLLSIGKVSAEEQDVKSGTYGLRAPLYLVTPANPRAEVRQFIEYFQGFIQQQKPAGIVAADQKTT